jgi:hypothetical protein
MRVPTLDLKMVYFRLMRSMTLWPTLVYENSKLRDGDGDLTANYQSLSMTARNVLTELQSIDQDLERLLHEKNLVSIVPSCRPSDPLPLMFEVKDTMAALAICHYAIFSIVVYRILLSLPVCETVEALQFEAEILNQCHRVWMLIEHSRRNRPLGLPVMQAALVFTFESANNLETRENILTALNELDGPRISANGPWRGEQLTHIARSLRGEHPVRS